MTKRGTVSSTVSGATIASTQIDGQCEQSMHVTPITAKDGVTVHTGFVIY